MLVYTQAPRSGTCPWKHRTAMLKIRSLIQVPKYRFTGSIFESLSLKTVA